MDPTDSLQSNKSTNITVFLRMLIEYLPSKGCTPENLPKNLVRTLVKENL